MNYRRMIGFTLVETLLYIAIASSVSVAVFGMIDFVQRAHIRQTIAADVHWYAVAALDRIAGLMQTSDPEGAVGEVSDSVALANGTIISVTGGVLQVVASLSTVALTPPDLVVEDISFVRHSASGSGSILSVLLTLQSRRASESAEYDYQRTFETSWYAR